MAIVAYFSFPYTPRPHGNSKHSFVLFENGAHAGIAAYGRRHKESTMSVYKDEVMRAAMEDTTPPHNRQQVSTAKHKERKNCRIAKPSKSRNFAKVSTVRYLMLLMCYLSHYIILM